MDSSEIIIAFLLAVVANIVTFFVTRSYTTRKDRETFEREQASARNKTADGAIGHLRSSYLAVKKLELAVRSRQREMRDEGVALTIWGIAQSLEQIRLGLQGHMNLWKSELDKDSDTYNEVKKLINEDIVVLPATIEQEPNKRRITPQEAAISPDKPTKIAALGIGKLMTDTDTPQDKRARLHRAVLTGDAPALKAILREAVEKRGDVDRIIISGCPLAVSGDSEARDFLIQALQERYEEMDTQARQLAVASVAQWYIKNDQEKAGVVVCESLAGLILDDERLPAKNKAHALNQIGMVFHGAGEFARGIEFETKAVELDPNEAAYMTNLAKSYQSVGDLDHARIYYEKALAANSSRAVEPIESAFSFFLQSGDHSRARDIFDILAEVDPMRAEMLRIALESATAKNET